MRYYLIAGEASGDLHASHLMAALQQEDPKAEFRFCGGEKMAAIGGTMVKHYRELAYMGFIPVLLHLPEILAGMRRCKADIRQWRPDVVILVDYPGFNLNIAKFVHQLGLQQEALGERRTRVYYYISPKIWAWKEYRIKNIRRDVDELFSILPFEVEWFAERDYPIHYVGNPTASEVRQFQANAEKGNDDFLQRHGLSPTKPIIALLCGSRRQEIKDNLPIMLEATASMTNDYQLVVAGAPAIERDYYTRFTQGYAVTVLPAGWTYHLLHNATAALVTSGTATLETCMFRVPQVVCYYTPLGRFVSWLRKRILKVRYISLVNLIARREVVQELVADRMTKDNIVKELHAILPGQSGRQKMLEGYDAVIDDLGDMDASKNAAREMVARLRGNDSADRRKQ